VKPEFLPRLEVCRLKAISFQEAAMSRTHLFSLLLVFSFAGLLFSSQLVSATAIVSLDESACQILLKERIPIISLARLLQPGSARQRSASAVYD
jgi:hypothetical protein